MALQREKQKEKGSASSQAGIAGPNILLLAAFGIMIMRGRNWQEVQVSSCVASSKCSTWERTKSLVGFSGY